MIHQLTYPSAELPAELKCQILAFLRVQWPEGFVGENRLRDWITKEEDHPIHIMLVEAGVLISHTNVVWKYLEHAGQIYKTYGLTGVFTYPAFGRQGYGSQIVVAGTAYISASDADIGMFHCGYDLRNFYAHSGWIPMENSTTLIGPTDNPIISNELMMMQFFSEKGQRGRGKFEREPVYFGEDSTW